MLNPLEGVGKGQPRRCKLVKHRRLGDVISCFLGIGRSSRKLLAECFGEQMGVFGLKRILC